MAKKIHPYVYIILTFVGVILLGTLLLAMPFSSNDGKSMGFIDALFTATSATCVTGLTVKNIAYDLTLFGKIVMILLMEVGGLSFITITVFFFTIGGARIGISNRFLLREALNQSSVEGLISLVRKIVLISFSIQLIFVFINWHAFYQYLDYCNSYEGGLRNIGLLSTDINDGYKLSYSFFLSLFHAAASFNNAGFDIVGNSSFQVFSSTSSVIPFSSIVLLNSTTMMMIVLGSLGFVVYDDVIRKRFKWEYFTLHTKLVLVTTALLIIIGTLLIWLTSNFAKTSDSVSGMPFMESMFTAITCRTAGFSSYDMSNLVFMPITYILCIFLMMVGASPCSTGGGVKTTTLAVTTIAIYYYARGKKAKAFKRRIDDNQSSKAFVLLVVAILIVLIGSVIVLAIQPNLGFDQVLFEVVSAFSTTGLTMGITTSLNAINRVIIVIIMFFGRLGPLTIMGVLNKNWMSNAKDETQYVKENVMIG